MAYISPIQTFEDSKGILTVFDHVMSFLILRLFYIYYVDDAERGDHRHLESYQAVICIQGSCSTSNNDGEQLEVFNLDSFSNA
jgi:hypothetical protein